VRVVFATVICVIAIGSFVADLWFPDFFGPVGIVFGALPLLSFAIVGSFLVVRGAGGPIGWLLAGAGAILQLVLLSLAYGSASLEPGAALPGGELALWFASTMQFAVFGLVISALVRFPDGRPPGRAFAAMLWAVVAFMVGAVVVFALAAEPIDAPLTLAAPHAGDPSRSIPNPFALHGPIGDLMLLAASALKLLGPLALIAPLALAVRFRRSRDVERQQLKWLTYTAAIAFGLALIAWVTPQGPIRVLTDATSVFGMGLLPVAIGIAITRHRLYDIDVLINRTVVYGATSAAIAVTFFVGIVALQALLRPLTSGSELAIAASTLVSFALFQPIRRRVQNAVDRRFDRSRYDAARTLDTFADQLRDEVDLDELRVDLLGLVAQSMAPAHVSLWLRDHTR
jgi:hypothetical protein